MEKFLRTSKHIPQTSRQNGDASEMKKAISIGFILAMLCILLPVFTASVHAAAAGYTHTTYFLANPVTMDGKWTDNNEWTDTETTSFGNGAAIFRSKWTASSDFSVITQYILVETLSDTTNDTSDLLQFCFDGGSSGPTGGAAPQTDDIRIDIIGHTNLTAYNGNGAGWTQASAPTSFTWVSSMSASPTSSTPHWIYEISIDKISFGIGPEYWMRIAFSDASNAAAGVQSWPPTSRDVPDNWGDIPYDMNPIPEGLAFGAMALLSSVAVLVGFFGLRKRLKINKLVQ
jgi:hypothetical protein